MGEFFSLIPAKREEEEYMDWNNVFNGGNGGTGNNGNNGNNGGTGNNGNNGGTDWTTLFAVTTTEVGGKVEAEGGKTRDHVTTTTAAALNESVANQNRIFAALLDALNRINRTKKKEAWYIAIMILLVAVVVGLVFYRYGIMLSESVYDSAGNVVGTRPDWWTIASRGACWSLLIVAFMLAISVGDKK